MRIFDAIFGCAGQENCAFCIVNCALIALCIVHCAWTSLAIQLDKYCEFSQQIYLLSNLRPALL